MTEFDKQGLAPEQLSQACRATIDYFEDVSRYDVVAREVPAEAEVVVEKKLTRRERRRLRRERRPRRERDIVRKLLLFRPLKRWWDRRKERKRLAREALPIVPVRPIAAAVSLSEREKAASVNAGYYGARALTDQERLIPACADPGEIAAAERRYSALCAKLAEAYRLGGPSEELQMLRRVAPCAAIREAFAAAVPHAASGEEPNDGPVYSILTPYYAHRDFFAVCARSVDALVRADTARTGATRIEWVVANDDPRIDVAALTELLPETLRPHVRFLSDGANRGIAWRLNEAAAASRGRWLLLLDCDDEIESDASAVLDHYVRTFPAVRYISSSMIDIDDDGAVLRFRHQTSDPTLMFEMGMTGGHLVAMRRELFEELGGYREGHSGCQDYDLAMRAALVEPLLVIPEYLYRYRWHGGSQSVGREEAQDRRTIFALRAFLDAFATALRPDGVAGTGNGPRAVGRGHCIIRTQGKRIELLVETLESLRWQVSEVEPIIVVHGDAGQSARVRADLAAAGHEPTVLTASRTDRRRGHPMNVALDNLRFSAPDEDYFFFLDDDDIVYPFFVERLTRALELSGADVAVALANRREPWVAPVRGHQPLPIAALLAGNFIPIHCYVTRVAALRATGVRCREDMDYLEDWDFLVGLVGTGASFHVIDDVLCEYRIFGDGNTTVRRDPAHFEDCRKRVLARTRAMAASFGPARYARDLGRFDFMTRAAMEGSEIGHLIDTRALFEGKGQG